ncbi:ECF transporter S component [Desulfofalx alkaliphila]|uniref:ECF transporter S component n=1 Tax=Desulfofalx alkaliphila TaxID=105483 RepID=UPI00068E6A0D|nr:ECF transporter S component [Desulfofalx alkaliphila]
MNWSLLTLGLAVLALLSCFLGFENSKPTAKEVALLATLAALAALGRVVFAGIPSVQPTTFLIIVTGLVFGPGPGFMVGALAALSSNFFLGMGPYTPWQMLAWGLAGFSAGIWGRWQKKPSKLPLIIFAVAWGFLYGLIMNIWHWVTFIYPLNWQTFVAVYGAAFWFDTLHAIGNGIFMWFMGKEFIKVMQRYQKRLVVKEINIER